jgi:hypothetical protein
MMGGASIVQGNAMKYFPGFLALVAFTCLSDAAFAQQHSDISGLWTHGGAANTAFRPPASGPGPVTTLRVPGQRVPRLTGDYNAPILQPWAAEVVRRQSDAVRAGKTVNAPQETCHPMGVPYILELNFHAQIIDDGKQIVFLYERHNQPRIARLNGSHPANLKASWFGDSVAHWEGDTLVVDTVGLAAGTWVDNFATPHTDKLHVVERYHRRDAGNLDVTVQVDDPGAFTTTWSALTNYSKDDEPWLEVACAENNIDAATGRLYDMPLAAKADF